MRRLQGTGNTGTQQGKEASEALQEASERQSSMGNKGVATVVKAIKRMARELTLGRNWGAGPHSSPKGNRGYRRKPKHKKREEG